MIDDVNLMLDICVDIYVELVRLLFMFMCSESECYVIVDCVFV